MTAVESKQSSFFEVDFRRALLDVAGRFRIEEDEAREILVRDGFFNLESQEAKIQSKACMALRLWLFHAAVLCEKMANGETLFSVVDPKFLVNLGDRPQDERYFTEGRLNGFLQARRVLIAHMNQLGDLLPESAEGDLEKYRQEEYLSNAICAAARWATIELEEMIARESATGFPANGNVQQGPWSKLSLH